MNKKELFKTMNGKTVIKEPIGVLTIEDTEKLKEQIEQMLKNNNVNDEIIEKENTFELKNHSNFWIKPKIKKYEEGIFTTRSKDYIFTNSEGENCYGEIPKKENLIILENGFVSVRKWYNNGNYEGMKYIIK